MSSVIATSSKRASASSKKQNASQTVSLTLTLTKKQAEILGAVAKDLHQPRETTVYGLLAHTLNTDHCSYGDFAEGVFRDLKAWERDGLTFSGCADADGDGWQYAHGRDDESEDDPEQVADSNKALASSFLWKFGQYDRSALLVAISALLFGNKERGPDKALIEKFHQYAEKARSEFEKEKTALAS